MNSILCAAGTALYIAVYWHAAEGSCVLCAVSQEASAAERRYKRMISGGAFSPCPTMVQLAGMGAALHAV